MRFCDRRRWISGSIQNLDYAPGVTGVFGIRLRKIERRIVAATVEQLTDMVPIVMLASIAWELIR